MASRLLSPAGVNVESVIFDRDGLLERIGHDAALADELIDLFCQELPDHLAAIRGAVAHGDCGELVRSAHSLKGSAAAIGAPRLRAIAAELEQLGHAGALDPAGGRLQRLALVSQELAAELRGPCAAYVA